MATVIGRRVRTRTNSHSVYHSINDVDLEEWESLRLQDGDPFMHPGLLQAVEESMSSFGRFEYIIFRDCEGRPIASACLCSYRVDATLLAEGKSRVWVERVSKICPWLFQHNVVFCGLPFSAGQSHLRIADDIDPEPILRELDKMAREMARRERAKCIVFKEFGDADTERFASLYELGYLRADSLPMNHAPTGFETFEHFVSSQKSRKRHPIRTSEKRFAGNGLRVVQMLGGDGADLIYTDEVHKLYEAVLSRATVKLERLPAEYFRSLARQMPENSSFTFIYQGDRVVAFAASVFEDQTYHQMFVGVDYELNPQVDLYFNLFFHALDAGYRQGPQVLQVGQSADTFKQKKLCCQPARLSFFVSGVDAFGKWVIRKMFHTLFPPRWGVAEASGAGTGSEE